ncbi:MULTISPECIES: ferredoxin [unclassified Frankia]|uniref:ferredoxin n=1 Tax=unclassified Frankia TaxID=2632575 RepID=UPI002AD315BF|nr:MULTISPECIES: ferredoxin [unclassified Frankia]
MRVSVDPSVCAGHGQCNVHGPDVYELEDGYCLITNPEVPADLQDQARKGAEACPEHAITVTD